MSRTLFDRTLQTPAGPFRVVAGITPYPDRDGFFYPWYSIHFLNRDEHTVPTRYPLDEHWAEVSSLAFGYAHFEHMVRAMSQTSVAL